MNFRVGQKVVRVGSTKSHERSWLGEFEFTYPEIGAVVTIRTINEWPRDTILTFYEHDNSHLVGEVSQIEPGFGARHFRPVVERKTSIEVFQKMLTPSPEKVMDELIMETLSDILMANEIHINRFRVQHLHPSDPPANH